MGIAQHGRALIHSILSGRRVNRESQLPEPLRSEVCSSLLRLGRLRRLPTSVPIMGFEVVHRGENELRFLFNEIFVEGCYFFRAQSDSPLIVDCGSNIGISILFFKKLYPNARIIGFEPDPLIFDALKTNVECNMLSNVTLYPYALSDRDDKITFYRAADWTLIMSTLKERANNSNIVVNCRRLSPFIVDHVDLLKVDIEGAEQQVLLDLAKTGKLRLVEQMHLEYHHHIENSADTLSETLRLLEDEGFGYQLKANSSQWPTPCFQDISIYCFRKR